RTSPASWAARAARVAQRPSLSATTSRGRPLPIRVAPLAAAAPSSSQARVPSSNGTCARPWTLAPVFGASRVHGRIAVRSPKHVTESADGDFLRSDQRHTRSAPTLSATREVVDFLEAMRRGELRRELAARASRAYEDQLVALQVSLGALA